MSDPLHENIRAHDRAARRYEGDHIEIFNPIEQHRLRERLTEAFAAARHTEVAPVALDLGAGTGNVTAHLLALGASVVAADVSPASLERLRSRFGSERCEIVVLGADGLAPLKGRWFDLVALYSVLHHVPDYLGFLEEAVALILPGGVLYVDHEPNDENWQPTPGLREWRARGAGIRSRLHHLREIVRPAWLRYRFRRLRDPRATLEGDIHVWPDDHVEWSAIEHLLREARFEVLSVRDHLQYRRHDDCDVYRSFAGTCADMRSLIARRLA